MLAAAQRGAFSGGAPAGEAFLGGNVAYLSAPGTAGNPPGPKRRCPQSQPLPPRADQHRLDHRHRPVVQGPGLEDERACAAPHPSSHSGCRTRYNGSRQPLSRFSARMLVACWVIRVTALENAAASANATATITSQISFPSRLHRPDIGPDNPPGLAGKDPCAQAAAP